MNHNHCNTRRRFVQKNRQTLYFSRVYGCGCGHCCTVVVRASTHLVSFIVRSRQDLSLIKLDAEHQSIANRHFFLRSSTQRRRGFVGKCSFRLLRNRNTFDSRVECYTALICFICLRNTTSCITIYNPLAFGTVVLTQVYKIRRTRYVSF